MALAAAPSHAGDNIRGGPLRTAKERLGGKASDEQHVDNCKVPPDLRGPKPGPERGGGGPIVFGIRCQMETNDGRIQGRSTYRWPGDGRPDPPRRTRPRKPAAPPGERGAARPVHPG